MEGRLVLKNGAILEGDGRLRTAVAVLVVGGRIAQIDDDARIPVLPGDWEVACRGRLIAPGRVDAHAHLVGDLLPAVSEGERERLACRLGASEVEVLTALGLARAALAGATLVCEHLRAPYCVGAALAAQQRVAGTLRLRLVHSHACADAEGGRSALAQLEESAAYASAVQGDSRVRSALGCGRASLLSDELMRETGRLSQSLGVGVHFHAAEDEEDLATTYARFGQRPVARAEAMGLLGVRSVAACGRLEERAEVEALSRSQTLVALRPWDLSSPKSLGLWSEARVAVGSSGGRDAGPGSWAFLTARSALSPEYRSLASGPVLWSASLYGGRTGVLEVGAWADLVVHETPVAASGGPGAERPFLLSDAARVAWTVVGGEVLVREGRLLGHDALELAREAARVVSHLGARGTP